MGRWAEPGRGERPAPAGGLRSAALPRGDAVVVLGGSDAVGTGFVTHTLKLVADADPEAWSGGTWQQ